MYITRDPFLAPDEASASRAAATTVPNGAQNDRPVLPPVTVRAVALGENSRALVDIGGITRIVGVGDTVGPLKVAAIRVDGIQFNDGSMVPLEGGDPP